MLSSACLREYNTYRSVPSKRPLPGKHLFTLFQGVNVAASIQTYGNYVPGKNCNVCIYPGCFGTYICLHNRLFFDVGMGQGQTLS